MFFDDNELLLRKATVLKEPPPIPNTGWKAPDHPPDLSGAAVIGFDVETKELDFEHGPGWARNKGHIIGVSLAARDTLGNTGKWYFPVRHEVEPQDNLNPAHVFPFIKSVLETPHIPKVGANLLYDIGWLTEENINVQGKLHDCQFAQALLHDRGQVNLDYLASVYTGGGKTTDLLYQWLSEAYGGNPNGDQRANLWRGPPRLVGPYAEDDAALPLDILAKQWPLLRQQGLDNVYEMEHELIPLLIAMRLQGVPIDVPAAEQLYDELAIDIAELYGKLHHETGVRVESVGSPEELARVFDAAGIIYKKTPTGKPSFQKEWLKELEHPIANLINDIREHEKIRGTFIKSYILESHHNGIIHCSFNPLRSDKAGTITGRFSSSGPNLQNIPVRTKLGKRIRALFIHFAGHIRYKKGDYSQIEYRMLAHDAVDRGDGSAQRMRDAYNNDPKTDYHNLVQNNVKAITGKEIERRPIKNINFGLIYGQSEKSLAYKAGFSPEEAKAFFKSYHEGASYVKPTMEALASFAQKHGYIQTILGRRIRFDYWEPITFGEHGMPLLYDAAIRAYGPMIRRAYGYRAVNYRFQGSAAEIIKAGMVRAWKEGVFAATGVPLLQVHDELDWSVRDDTKATQEAFAYMTHVMENTVKLRVPIRFDTKDGVNWGAID